ncbi:RNA polymerase sigma factor (sigma-70 family) [Streptomyces sp. V4I23]|uniref:RNA polymerase sigma factor SigJ n=1 Tax=Streptomyces sp. V4I23 TaxID=3042282 RepID=UPI00277FFC35|nr:RNA polymerase sigma factor SigJ [Streptomyces sp. V4I23]MDQ1012865.1 RNA polymerase sigma factor (sigma-70 family) [Streptomyces sp. V4I23]
MSDSSRDSTSGSAARAPGDAPTQVFVEHRELLFAVVYNILGSVADTEDVLQETWLSWAGSSGRRSSAAEIGNPRAYLVRIAVNHALAWRARISRRRETYIGPWLPEPLITPEAASPRDDTTDTAERALRTEAVSMALLVVMETLSPLERAVFVLHEAFGFAHTEIADILDRSPAAVRQLAHRAREHVQARRPRYRAHPRIQQQVTERFVAAALGGDVATLMEILAPDVTLWTDGGGNARAALRPVQGRQKVARLLAGYASRPPRGLDVRYRRVNGAPSAVIFAEDAPYAVMVMDLTQEGDQVCDVFLVTNPEKLSAVERDEEAAPEASPRARDEDGTAGPLGAD